MVVLANVAFSSAVFPPAAEAGSLVIPAWSFARGNAQIFADPARFADAGPVVGSGPRQPWGWTVEYDVDLPVDGDYTIEILYASAEARPIEVFFDSQDLGKCCLGVTLAETAPGEPDAFTANSSAAKWEGVANQWGRFIKVSATEGKHTVKLTRREPLPHFVTLRVNTSAAFPESWQPPRFEVRDLDAVSAAHRNAFVQPQDVDVATLRLPVEDPPAPQVAGSLAIPAVTFDRGNARIFASPDRYADAGPLIGSDPQFSGDGVVEYDVDFPSTGEYMLHVSYASAEARPVTVSLDGKPWGKVCYDATFDSAPFELPVRLSFKSSSAIKKWEGLCRKGEKGQLVKLTVTKGKHTLRFARRGPLPHLVALQLDSSSGFPDGYQAAERTVRHLDRVPVTHRSAFLPPDAVNVAAMRLAIEDMTANLGPAYLDGKRYLEQLAALERKQTAATNGTPEQQQEVDDALKALRREAMLAHPALKFDKLLFVKRTSFTFNTYQDSKANTEGGNLCVLSPVSADGKVITLVPELEGGLFSRFDLSFDAKRVVFGYKKKDGLFRIYEIRLDPATAEMVPGSLRQLTFDCEEETAAQQRCEASGCGVERGFDDMDPCYLPDGRVMFASTRSMRRVFCNPSIVTTLYLMDADGGNMRRLSSSPLNEVDPCLLDDGRVVYTRWEYVDKGLGNGQSLWAMRPDGSGVEHVYKNSIVRPAQLIGTRSIPGSRRLITVGAPHCGGRQGGPVILVDHRLTRRDTDAMTCLTPEIAYPCMHQAVWTMGFFKEPYPFSEKFFLVSHAPGSIDRASTQYGLYVLDAWGNRAELYREAEISCFQPTPLRPRRMPGKIASLAIGDAEQGSEQQKTATLFVQDVYEGMTGIERGRVKYLRVMGPLPWPWDENGIFRIGLAGNVHRKRVYGVVKVHEDGSAQFNVPAEENVFFQALDENYMTLQHMPTFINLMPGESRSCIGCHEHRSKAPGVVSARPEAFGYPVQTIVPQPGDTGPRMVHYASDVQPAFDQHCVGCHSGENPVGRVDLSGEPTDTWNRSYETLMGKGLVSFRDCRYGRAGFRPGPPLSFGSHLSELVERIRSDPCKSNLSREQFIRIVTWIDANTPYYGTYRGKRDIQHKDQPDFRLPPLVVRK